MKRFILIFAFILCFTPIFSFGQTFANNDEESYARITDDEVFLYKILNEQNQPENILFKLPKSYFVILKEETEDFFYVKFQDFCGYVQKDKLQRVYETPATPFPVDITFSINKIASAIVKDNPSVEGKNLGIIPSGKKVNFVGEVQGDEAIVGLGNTWFFCSFEEDDQILTGYIYSALTENLSPIPENTEELSLTPHVNANSFLSENITNTNNLWLVGVLCVVAFFLFCITFFPFLAGRRKHTKLLKETVSENWFWIQS